MLEKQLNIEYKTVGYRSTCLLYFYCTVWCHSTFTFTVHWSQCIYSGHVLMGIEHTTLVSHRALPVTGTKRLVEGQWSPKVSLQWLYPSRSLQWDSPIRHTSKSWLAAVTRTVEWRTGAMCVSQWLTSFQKSQDLMPQETTESRVYLSIWIHNTFYIAKQSLCNCTCTNDFF